MSIEKQEVDYICRLAEQAAQDGRARITLSRTLLGPIEDAARASGKIECCKGCAYCCYLRVEVFSFELDAIQTYLEHALNEQQLDTVKRQLVETYPRVNGLTDVEHHGINVRCPFLLDDQCSIYPVRPLACAGYNSARAALCRRSNDDPHDTSFGIPQDPNIGYAKMRQLALVQMALDETFDDCTELVTGMCKRLVQQGELPRQALVSP